MATDKVKTSSTQVMLRAIVNGQSAMKGELLGLINKNQKELTGKIDSLEKKVDDGFKKVNKRLDSIGESVAYLEDDASTWEEHDKLEKRVKKIEKKLAFV